MRTLAGSAATPTDPNFENVTLLLHGDGTNGGQNNTFVDGSTNNFTITRNGNTTQGTFSPYGDNWSNYFDGNGDRLRLDDSGDWDFGTSDFTIEMWVCFNVLPTTDSNTRQTLISTYESTSPPRGWNLQIGVGPNNVVNWGWGDTLILASSAPGWKVNQWYHLAVARSGTSVKIFIDGAQVGSATDSTSLTGSANGVTIGALYFSVPGGTFVQHTNAYISNVRILKGTAQYTAAFTPSTTPLTAITNTVLLTCQSNRFKDNSSSNRTITRNGDVSVQRFSPFSPTAAYAAGTIGGSGYFDGTGDYLQLTGGDGFNLTGDFTVEAWIYRTTSGSQRIVGKWNLTGNLAWVLETSTTAIGFGVANSGTFSASLSFSATINLFAWNHVAVSRSGSTVRAFLNGVDLGSATSSANCTANNTNPIQIGQTENVNYVNGYVCDVRVLKGTAQYTAAFTPPTAPLTAITNTSLLLNFTNAAILDNAMMAVPETVGNAQISTSVKKYGTGSLYFDGNGDYLVSPANQAFAFGTGDFTIEFWLRAVAFSNVNVWVDTRNAGDSAAGFVIYTNSSGQVVAYSGVAAVITSSAINTGQWYHIAASRASGTLRLFIDGTSAGSASFTNNLSNTNLFVGRTNESAINYVNGYIDDLRITKGVARYTANFTPPTAALPDL